TTPSTPTTCSRPRRRSARPTAAQAHRARHSWHSACRSDRRDERRRIRMKAFISAAIVLSLIAPPAPQPHAPFHLEEATIAEIQAALLARQLTTVDLVKRYLARIKAYNGTCVNQPDGLLGPITTIPHAGQLNALGTLNLRPATRKAMGFDDHHARSLT